MAFTSVLVVNFDGRHFLDDCLTALERQTLPRHQYEVLLIDNGSTDGSVEFVRERFPGVRVIELRANTGFTGANNAGFQLARGQYIVLLNNDTRVDPNWLKSLVDTADKTQAGGAASHIVFKANPNVINSTGLVLLRDGRGADRDLNRPDGTANSPDVFGGCGAAVLLRRELIDDLGGFDPALFMYYEDLDLAWRARLRGWDFVYDPEARVEHVGGGTSDTSSPFVLQYVERNRALVNIRNGLPFQALWSGIGLVLRTARVFVRRIQGDSRHALTSAHVRGMTAALASVIGRLPGRMLARYETRVARRRGRTTDLGRWMVQHP